MSDYDRRILGSILVDFDQTINDLDRMVFEEAHCLGDNLDTQREHAMSSEFQSSTKCQRDQKMEQRNLIARLLGFQPRTPHDMSPRDYVVRADGLPMPRGAY